MILDYAENGVQLISVLIALLLSLFGYISRKNRGWLWAIIFFLSFLLSSYYWTSYFLIMGVEPNVSALMAYFGWNIAYLALLALVIHVKTGEERKYFHPLMLLPVPLNIWQLSVYLPFGGELNSIYQVTVCTAIACLSLQSICWYAKNRKSGARPPRVACAALLFVTFEFGMWTTSCFDVPVSYFYFPFSLLCSGSFLAIVWALKRHYHAESSPPPDPMDIRVQNALKLTYLGVVLTSSMGGILLGVWMRNALTASARADAVSGIYDIIPVVLFIISLFLVAFAVTIILIVNFRERSIENGKLQEARKIAEHSSAVKSDFLANVSHEIRTPINAVLGMNEMILRESLHARDVLPREREEIRAVFSEICGYAGNIESAGNSLLSLINDILDLSRIEAGKLEITKVRYKLSGVLSDVNNIIYFKARSKNLEYRVDIEEDLPDELFGDEIRVRQVMINLLNNAVKYTDRGSIRLTIRSTDREKPAPGETIRLEISVQDTGIGIRPEDKERLFRKFERVDMERNSTVEGSGLGLAITQNLLEMMDGSIDVQSVYGEGSTFTAVLPQQVVSCEPVGDFHESYIRSIRSVRTHRGLFRAPDARILIADDTRLNLTVAAGLLKKTGIRIDAVTSGAEALERTRATAYDIILMDQRMPNMDGTETLSRIRSQKNGANRETPVICMTADAVSGARERYLAAGFTDYLTKPIDSHVLEQMLMSYLPEDKIQPTAEDGAEDEPPDGGADGAESIRVEGLDTRKGLQYCQNDEELYRTLLREFLRSTEGKKTELREAYQLGDWKRYGLLAHTLKSTSGMIGADMLSEQARRLEAAADAGLTATIRNEHENMLAEMTSVTEAIYKAVGAEKERFSEPDGTGEQMFEFLPEEE